MECIFDFVEHPTDFERLGGAGCVINSSLAIFRHADCPFGQVSRVDELHWIAWFAGGQHFAASIDAHRPISEAIGLVPRSDYEARSDDYRFSGKPFLSFFFGQCLEGTISLI